MMVTTNSKGKDKFFYKKNKNKNKTKQAHMLLIVALQGNNTHKLKNFTFITFNRQIHGYDLTKFGSGFKNWNFKTLFFKKERKM